MLKIAITGGVATGKTQCLHMLHEMGYPTISSDDITINLLTKNQAVINKLDLMIPGVVSKGVVDKRYLRSILFKDKVVKEKIENLLHPLIKSIREKYIEQQISVGKKFVFCEVPLLFEKQLESNFDYSILIVTSLDIRLEMFRSRGGNEDSFFEIVENQLPDNVKKKKANFVIYNNSTVEDLKNNLISVVKKLTA